MNDLMATAVQMISRESQRVETSAQNIANAATPGYKRQIAFDGFVPGDAQSAPPAAMAGPAHAPGRNTDFSAAPLKHTANPMDLAVSGPGFLQFADADRSLYLRTATLRRDGEGRLVTTQGWRLQSADGGDVVVAGDDWKLELDGTVVDGGVPGAALKLVEFADLVGLIRISGNAFVASAEPLAAESSRVRQGYLEGSNVSLGADMVQIMEAMRRIESAQKLVHAYDDMVGSALQRLGEM